MKSLFILFLFPLSLFAQTEREKEMMREINYVRTKPAEYAQYIDSYLEYWNSDADERRTAEELRKQLKKMKPLPPVKFSPELYDAAKKHGDWMKRTKEFEHSDFEYAENLVSGDSIVRYAMLNLLIDHGIPGRGHRKNILDERFKEAACYEIPGAVGQDEYVFIQEFW